MSAEASPDLFELAWRGGATEARLHRRRPGIDELPWGSIDLAAYDAAYLLEARRVWSHGVFTEYASAAAFSALTTAMMECGAPVDLVAASGDIVVDELFHVELSSRLVMELGGAIPIAFDLANIAPAPSAARPLLRAAEIALVTSCVGESLSVPAIARSRMLAREPLARGVLDRLLVDEGPHARLGFWFLGWASARLSDAERAALATMALDAIEVYAPLWQAPCDACPAPTAIAGTDAIGKADMRDAVIHLIARPLARFGIELDGLRLAGLVA
ncbi:MAG: hypothetical protein NT062_34400 [Proteobacteria bacterium]|nr:hypothetical protein [Pseudomonadota bacterium]